MFNTLKRLIFKRENKSFIAYKTNETAVICRDYTCGAKSFYRFANLQLVSFTDNSTVQRNTSACSLSEKERYSPQKKTKAPSENEAINSRLSNKRREVKKSVRVKL